MEFIDNRNILESLEYDDIKLMVGKTFMMTTNESDSCVVIVTDERSLVTLSECVNYDVGTIFKDHHIDNGTTFSPVNSTLTIR